MADCSSGVCAGESVCVSGEPDGVEWEGGEDGGGGSSVCGAGAGVEEGGDFVSDGDSVLSAAV